MLTRTMHRTRSTTAPPLRLGVEQHVAKLESQLETLRAQVRQAQQLAGLGTTMMTLVHEVSNLLTPMKAYAQAALGANDPELMRKALTITLANTETLVAHAERTLQLGAAAKPNPSDTNIANAIQLARQTLCRDLEKDGIQFRCDVDPQLSVFVDPLQIRQVFFNLFLNAKEALAGSHSGSIRVHASLQGNTVSITVADSGKGIAPDALPHIFDALQSSKLHSRGPRCGGLGLSLCRELVADAGGRIFAESQLGVGTKFILELPHRGSSA